MFWLDDSHTFVSAQFRYKLNHNKMDKNQTDYRNQQNDDMSKEKTNEDYNKQKPNPNDPNQNKNHQIGDDDYELNKRREVTANIGRKQQHRRRLK